MAEIDLPDSVAANVAEWTKTNAQFTDASAASAWAAQPLACAGPARIGQAGSAGGRVGVGSVPGPHIPAMEGPRSRQYRTVAAASWLLRAHPAHGGIGSRPGPPDVRGRHIAAKQARIHGARDPFNTNAVDLGETRRLLLSGQAQRGPGPNLDPGSGPFSGGGRGPGGRGCAASSPRRSGAPCGAVRASARRTRPRHCGGNSRRCATPRRRRRRPRPGGPPP